VVQSKLVRASTSIRHKKAGRPNCLVGLLALLA